MIYDRSGCQRADTKVHTMYIYVVRFDHEMSCRVGPLYARLGPYLIHRIKFYLN